MSEVLSLDAQTFIEGQAIVVDSTASGRDDFGIISALPGRVEVFIFVAFSFAILRVISLSRLVDCLREELDEPAETVLVHDFHLVKFAHEEE